MGFKLQILPSFFKKKNNLSSFSTVKLPSQKGFSKHILRRIFDANFQPLARIAKSVSNKFNLRPRYFMLPRTIPSPRDYEREGRLNTGIREKNPRRSE